MDLYLRNATTSWRGILFIPHFISYGDFYDNLHAYNNNDNNTNNLYNMHIYSS